MTTAIELEGVCKSYGATCALAPLHLTLPAGQTTVLIGPSGCGKSTLLRAIVGLIDPDAGRIRVGELTLDATSLLQVRRSIGYLLQEGGLFPHLSAAANVTLLARYLGWSEGDLERRVAELAELTQLPADALDRYPGELSGGQRQRVGLMRALMLDPDCLLLDEPLGALDPMIRAELQSDLREIFRRLGKTVVMVTHDLAEAAYFADQIVLLRAGALIQRGTLDELLRTPADPFVTAFVRAQRRTIEFDPDAPRDDASDPPRGRG